MIKYVSILISVFFLQNYAFAQFETNSNSVQFGNNETNINNPNSFEIPAIKKPTLSNIPNPNSPINSSLGKEKPAEIDFSKGDGLLEYSTNKTPKYFTKDKEEKAEYGKDQYLGDFKTTSKYVTIMYRDHEYVDGDLIRIFVNGEILKPSVMLDGSFRGFNLTLQSGFNKVDFQALNQGTSGPNTAQLQIMDEIGNVLAAYEWNLLTGNKATAIVVKQ